MLQAGAFATILNELGEVLLCHRPDLLSLDPPIIVDESLLWARSRVDWRRTRRVNPSKAANRRWAVIHGGDSPRGSVDPGLDLWNAPGGRVEAGESPWEAVVREIREETGVEAEVVRLASISWKPERQEMLFQFVCSIVAGQLSLTDECDGFAYFPLDKLPEPLGPAFRSRLLEWSQNPDETCSSPMKDPLHANCLSVACSDGMGDCAPPLRLTGAAARRYRCSSETALPQRRVTGSV